MYHDGSRELQDRFDTRRLADRLEDRIVTDTISDGTHAFIEARDMFFLATADADGVPNCSYKGGDPGFVRVVDERTIAFPNYDGNGMYLSMGNLLKNPDVGILFIDFEKSDRVRFNGTATVDDNDLLLVDYRLVERSHFVPKADHATHVPDWKRSLLARDVLPAGHPAAG